MITTDTAAEFVISRTFDASRERLWQAWTDPAQMAQWLGPKGTTGTTLAADLKPGGLLHWCMNGPDGSTMWGRAIYRKCPRRSAWSMCSPSPMQLATSPALHFSMGDGRLKC